MVKANRSDNADLRLDNIGSIQPSSQPHLDYLKICPFRLEVVKAESRSHLKSGQPAVGSFLIDNLDLGLKLLDQGNNFFVSN